MIHSVDICPPVVLCCVSSEHSNQKKNEYFYSAFNYKQRQKCQLAHLCETAFFFEKKNYMSLSCFPQKILVIFRPKILFCSLSKHKFLRKRVTCFADIFLLSRVGLMTNTWAAVLKRISYIFSFFLLLKFNTTTYSGKGNESNPFAEHATACGACKHQIQVFSAGSNLQQNCFFGKEYMRSVQV